MNEIIKKVILAGDKFMSEIRLRRPVFTYLACVPFTKNEKRIQKFNETEYKNLILLRMDINVVLLQWSITFLIK